MTENNNKEKVPERNAVPSQHCWDLSKLFKNVEAWEEGLKELEGTISKIEGFKGKLGESPEGLLECLEFNKKCGVLEERLGYYAHLKTAEDGGDSQNQGRFARCTNVASRLNAAKSYQIPEIQRIPDDVMAGFMESDALSEYKIYLKKILRYKPHVLGENEERLLAMQKEFSQTAESVFSSLTNVDMDFGEIDTPEGKRPLTQSSYGSYIIKQDRDIRQRAYMGLLKEYDCHKHSLAGLYNGSVQLDIYNSKVRNFKSSIESALFSDDVPLAVYTNLIGSVHNNLDALHYYYEVRRKAMKIDELRLYDTRVPLVENIELNNTYEQAVELVIKALKPLGEEYTLVLKEGLSGGWVDRYENKGKRSGAFSAGSYAGDPYILMNYKDDVFNDVFTLAHEAGHSMHSWYSIGNNPFQHYNYTIFVAEVASTFNEQLLAKHLLENADNDRFKAYLINKQIDDIIATVYRQTMFAEFEKLTHEMVENNQPLTIDSLRAEYRKLLERYFGPRVKLEELSDMEGLRIPHFYHAFYVYKYATGLSAAIALSKNVLNGGESDLGQYKSFLKTGGSKFPLEQLKDAGVDMATPGPVNSTLATFRSLVEQLEKLLAVS